MKKRILELFKELGVKYVTFRFEPCTTDGEPDLVGEVRYHFGFDDKWDYNGFGKQEMIEYTKFDELERLLLESEDIEIET